jgi:excisionase family DNA binding protein
LSSSLPDLLESAEALLTPGEVARLFRVDPKTVARWEKDGRLASVKTLGGHRRYPRTQINTLLDARPDHASLIRTLQEARDLATDTGAHTTAAHIDDLITTLHTQDDKPRRTPGT